MKTPKFAGPIKRKKPKITTVNKNEYRDLQFNSVDDSLDKFFGKVHRKKPKEPNK